MMVLAEYLSTPLFVLDLLGATVIAALFMRWLVVALAPRLQPAARGLTWFQIAWLAGGPPRVATAAINTLLVCGDLANDRGTLTQTNARNLRDEDETLRAVVDALPAAGAPVDDLLRSPELLTHIRMRAEADKPALEDGGWIIPPNHIGTSHVAMSMATLVPLLGGVWRISTLHHSWLEHALIIAAVACSVWLCSRLIPRNTGLSAAGLCALRELARTQRNFHSALADDLLGTRNVLESNESAIARQADLLMAAAIFGVGSLPPALSPLASLCPALRQPGGPERLQLIVGDGPYERV
ncbi:MAG: TIGR04222 domain-containing membrane protein [Planctomycetota bacterium]